MSKFIALILAVFFIFFDDAVAVEISGSDDPEFLQAVQDWLNDDDAASLPVLSNLAHDGNRAARYLLGQIEKTTHFNAESDYVNSLDRKQRLAIFRAPGGLGGTSWLDILTDDGEQLATLITELKKTQYDFDVISRLTELGERRQVSVELVRHLQYGNYEILISLAYGNQLSYGDQFYAWLAHLYKGSASKEELKKVIQKLTADSKSTGVESVLMTSFAYDYLNPKTEQLRFVRRIGKALYRTPITLLGKDGKKAGGEIEKFADWLVLAAPKTEALYYPYVFCRKECPEDTGRCMASSIGLIGGYEKLKRLRSPLENLIPNTDYIISERAHRSLLRHLKAQSKEFFYKKNLKISSCLARNLSEN